MEFWRIFRLVWGKRWLIFGIVVVTTLVIFVGATLKGQRQLYEAVAIIAPLEGMQPQTPPGSENGTTSSAPTVQQDISARISDLVMQLRSSNDLYLRTADLLRQNLTDRTESVKRILEKNGYFAQTDAEVESQIKRGLASGEIRPSEVATLREQQRQSIRNRIVASLVEARDALGTFREGGIERSQAEISDIIRQKMTFDIVTGPLDTDSNRQIVNQIRIAARFAREAEADLYVNMLCVAFIDFYTSKSAGAANARIAQTNEKLREAKRQLDEAQKAESDYRKSRGVALTSAQETMINQYVQLQTDRDAALRSYNEAVASVTELEKQVAATASTNRNALPSEENPAVRDLQQRVDAAQIRLDELRRTYLDEWDAVKTAKAELEAARNALQEAKARQFGITSANPNRQTVELQLNAAKVQRDAAQQRLSLLTQQLAQATARIRALPEAQFAVGDLRRDTAIADRNVTTLTDQLRKYEMQAIDESKAGTINIVSQAHAELVGGDIAKQRPKLLAFGILLSVICGMGLVVLMDALDNSLRTAEDVERSLHLPVIGVIPEHLPDPNRASRVAYLSPLSPVSEAYRLLRTDLLFTREVKPFHSLMIVTSKPGQGATTTVSNLAITLAQAGKRVILVDANLRFPKLHEVFGLPNEAGLTTLLGVRRSDESVVSIDDVLLPVDPQHLPNLWLLPSGPIPRYPSEMLASEQMRYLHEQLKDKADFVLFDTPAAAAFADAAVLSAIVDTTLLVVRSKNVPRGAEEHLLRLLEKARANVIGVVLNGVPSEQVDSVHYHEEYYPQLASGQFTPGSSIAPRSDTPYGLQSDHRAMLSLASPNTDESPAAETTQEILASPVQATDRGTVLGVPKRMLRRFHWQIAIVALIVGVILGAIILRVAFSVNVR